MLACETTTVNLTISLTLLCMHLKSLLCLCTCYFARIWFCLLKNNSKQDMQQPHKFNIHISILCSEESMKGILGKINCKSFDASDKPRQGKTPAVSLLVCADPG